MHDIQMYVFCPECGRLMQAKLENGTPDITELMERTVTTMLQKHYGETKKQDSPFKTYLDMIEKGQRQWLSLMSGLSEKY